MAQITALIEKQIGQHIANPTVLTKQLINGKIQGKFKAANRVYNYVLTRKDLQYSPAGNMDSALFSALYLQRFDAVAKRPRIGKSNCTYKSYQCGKICLGLRRRCKKNVNDVERVAKIFELMERDERTGKTLYAKAIGNVAEGDRAKVIARAQKMRNSEERGAKARELLEQRRKKQTQKEMSNQPKPSRLINPKSPILKPQNQISDAAKNKAVESIQSYFKDFELSDYHSRLLASELADQSIMDQIKRTAPTAPNVYLSDRDKIESIVMNAKRIANTLDEAEELDKLLDQLVKDDARRKGNSA